jgi:hypothetical protein
MATSVHPGLHVYDIDSDIDIPAGEQVADMDADQGQVEAKRARAPERRWGEPLLIGR